MNKVVVKSVPLGALSVNKFIQELLDRGINFRDIKLTSCPGEDGVWHIVFWVETINE